MPGKRCQKELKIAQKRRRVNQEVKIKYNSESLAFNIVLFELYSHIRIVVKKKSYLIK
jgi:hypothetical protein